jgi:branched-chain amino acid transport system ATP-binding protein
MSESVLVARGVTKTFGGVTAVSHVDLEVYHGEIRAIIGPNGSGKSTFVNVVSGLYKPTAGSIQFRGQEVAGLSPHVITRHGLTRTFQNLRLFRELTVLENVMIGYQWRVRASIIDVVLARSRDRAVESEVMARARITCRRVGIEELCELRAGSLSYGQQRRVEIARALVAEPHVVLLDEPVAGMNPVEVGQLALQLREIQQDGVTIVLIEHNVRFVMDLADRVTVLDHGEKIFEGRPDEAQRDARVIDAYLGRDDAAA